MNTEKLITKGVEKHFNGQEVLFSVESLNEHYSGLLIHESDYIAVEEKGIFVKVGDINFDNATSNEVEVPAEETPIDLPVLENETPAVEEIETVDAETVSETPVSTEEAPAPTEEVAANTTTSEDK